MPVNRLRYQNIPRYDRKCEKCDLNEIGDEFHYLFVCPFLTIPEKNVFLKDITKTLTHLSIGNYFHHQINVYC